MYWLLAAIAPQAAEAHRRVETEERLGAIVISANQGVGGEGLAEEGLAD